MESFIRRCSLAALLGAVAALPASGQDQPAAAKPPAASDAHVAQLIEQLGSSDFTAREKAQAELAKLGLVVFDALSDAQHHDDIEIALRARYLVRSMQVNWHTSEDPPHVVQILRSYGELSELERKSRIDMLQTLPNREGVAALCRLARFEVSDELSKQAALHVLGQPPIADAAARAAEARRIGDIVGTGKRTAASWLRTYVKTLEDAEASLPLWAEHAQAEHDLLTKFPERTTRDIVRDLYRFQVALLQQSQQPDRAVAVIRQSLSLMEGTPEQLAEIVSWLIHREVWSVVEEIAERFPQAFTESPTLLYLRAEALRKQQHSERAEAYAKLALEIASDKLDDHLQTARELQKRGLFDWAEREYRGVMARAKPADDEGRRAHSLLAEMLHDSAQELAAAQVLQSFIDAMDKELAGREQGPQNDFGPVRSRMHYFYALDLQEKGELEKAIDQLDRGIQFDPTDADVLIALYRLPNQDEQRRKQTLNYITKATEQFREEIDRFKLFADQQLDDANRARYSEVLANAYNQLAWLVSNTTGDYDEALNCSLKSNELMPKYAAYLDTLGRCYFAKGDFENAIRYQTLAIQEDPHSGQMKRQLALFVRERDARKAKNDP